MRTVLFFLLVLHQTVPAYQILNLGQGVHPTDVVTRVHGAASCTGKLKCRKVDATEMHEPPVSWLTLNLRGGESSGSDTQAIFDKGIPTGEGEEGGGQRQGQGQGQGESAGGEGGRGEESLCG
eukprot:762432-Hanusia_phi.AAC.1